MKVLVTTSGIGSRLGELTDFTNKSLVPVGDKPALGHIIEAYPHDTSFVVTIGHYGELVRQFLEVAYPDRLIEIVAVENFSGPGSSLAQSMLEARSLLQEPFIYNAGDTIWSGLNTDLTDVNWLVGQSGGGSNLYASFDSVGQRITSIHPKGSAESDYLYVGIAGVVDYEEFWLRLDKLCSNLSSSSELNDLSVISEMIAAGHTFEARYVQTWHDIGSLEGLAKARASFDVSLPTLEKRDEAIFYINGHVVKFFADEKICAGRIARSGILAPEVPSITRFSKNWYAYSFVEGTSLGHRVTPAIFERLLTWAEVSLWGREHELVSETDFNEALLDFYFRKTKSRLEKFFQRSGLADKPTKINGKLIPSATTLVDRVRKSGALQGKPSTIHGDFILDNLIFTGSSFVAIDWRHAFGSFSGVGDLYYDLAKLRHSLTMNHAKLEGHRFECSFDRDEVWVDVDRKASLVACESVLEDYVSHRNLDMQQVELLTPIIWLNMAPLHSHPLDMFLHFYGRLMLSEALSNIEAHR